MCFGWFGMESNVPVSAVGLRDQRVSAWGMLTGHSLGWQPSVGRTGSREGPGIEKGAPLGGVEDFCSGRWEVRFSGAERARVGRERKKVNRWEEPPGSISLQKG